MNPPAQLPRSPAPWLSAVLSSTDTLRTGLAVQHAALFTETAGPKIFDTSERLTTVFVPSDLQSVTVSLRAGLVNRASCANWAVSVSSCRTVPFVSRTLTVG